MTYANQFLKQYGLRENHIYLLELIPLIKMIWADGKAQEEEIAILERFAMQHLTNLYAENEGILPVSIEETNTFIQHFIHKPPSSLMLKDLNLLCADRISQKSDAESRQMKTDEIIDFCLDIAAACASSHPHFYNERVVPKEKQLIRELIQSFQK